MSPAVKKKNKKATGRQGRALTDNIDPSSLNTKADKDLAPVVNVKKGAGHQDQTGQGGFGCGYRVLADI